MYIENSKYCCNVILLHCEQVPVSPDRLVLPEQEKSTIRHERVHLHLKFHFFTINPEYGLIKGI